MKARTSIFSIFAAALFVLAMVSHGYSAQTSPEQGRANMQNQSGDNPNPNNNVSGSQSGQSSATNEAGQCEAPRVGNTGQPVIIRHIGWSWLLITGLIGYAVGRATNFRRRPYGRDDDIPRNRAA